MPQGVMNAPSTFQRLIEQCMGDMCLKDAYPPCTVIVFSRTLEEHEERLMRVLTHLKEFGSCPQKNVSSSRHQFII